MTATIAQVQQTTRDLLAEFGEDYVYPFNVRFSEGCYYAVTEDGEPPTEEPGTVPSCIVGQIAYRLDRDAFNALAQVDVDLTHRNVRDMVASMITPLTPATEKNAFVDRILDVQAIQDTGVPWGEAAKSILEWGAEK